MFLARRLRYDVGSGLDSDVPESRLFIDPVFRELCAVVENAWHLYNIRLGTFAGGWETRTITNVVYQFMLDGMKQLAIRSPYLTYWATRSDSHFLITRTNPSVAIRFKKVSPRLRTSNIPTEIQREMSLGADNVDLFQHRGITNLVTIGYVFNDLHDGWRDIYGFEREGAELLWYGSLKGGLDDYEGTGTFGQDPPESAGPMSNLRLKLPKDGNETNG